MFDLKNKNIPAVERAHRIVTTLMRAAWPMGITDLSRDLDLSKSTVHGLVHTLVNLGVLETFPKNPRLFRPASGLISIWRGALLEGALARGARPLLERFMEKHGLTALAGLFLQARVLIVEAVLAPGLGVSAYAGQMMPARASALGKVMLAALPEQRVRKVAAALAADMPVSREALLDEVDEVRAAGVALDREEYLPGVRALAAAVPGGGAHGPLAAVWTVGLSRQLDDARLSELGPEVLSLARRIGERVSAEADFFSV